MNGFEKLLHLGYNFADAQLQAFERQLLGTYKKAWEETNKELIVLYKDGPMTLAEMQKYKRLQNLEGDLKALYQYYSRAGEKIQFQAFGTMLETGRNGMAYAIEAFNPDPINFGMVNPAVIEAALANPHSGFPLIKTLRDNESAGITKVWKTVVNGLARGLGYAEQANSVKDVFEKSSVASAMRVLRTEGHRAQVAGQNHAIDQAEESGVEGSLYWMATLDDRTRDSHQDMDGVEADKDGLFTFISGDNEGATTEGPGLSGIAEEDIGCRCRVGYKIAGLEPDTRHMRDPLTGKTSIISYQTYSEWADQFGSSGRKQYVARVTAGGDEE